MTSVSFRCMVTSDASVSSRAVDMGIKYFETSTSPVQNFKRQTVEELADVRKRAIVVAGVYTGTALEYWNKKV